MTPKRKDRVAPPPARGRWDLRYAQTDVVDGWDELSRQAPRPTFDAWEAIAKDPRDWANPRRQHPLRGDLATHVVSGRTLEQWQYEVTGAGRIWYCIDDEAHTVWLTAASTGHPKATE
ncbi:MAG: hypothetical protein A2289_00285 [Deltaproteobacteria bacterium RIFOXYA12_FULL_58_15]|nr:MAG: hypothetical protein A2289_00285 [Deltaproteobacteria bacterium RIFOXYA12_FULL_58_15]